jgi:hypothetical protein
MRINNIFGTVFSGAIGKKLIASSWKGKEYIRAYTRPRNPKTRAQQEHRALFAEAVKAWKKLGIEERKALDRQAVGMTGFNLFVSRYVKARLNESMIETKVLVETRAIKAELGLDMPVICPDSLEALDSHASPATSPPS